MLKKIKQYLESRKDTSTKNTQSKVEDKFIYCKFIEQALENIINANDEKIQQSNIYVLMKKYDYNYCSMIYNMAINSKSLNIVCQDMQSYTGVEQNIYNQYGINIMLLNNRRKSLLKAKYIINVDFQQEDINKYNINRYSIIFNISPNKISKLRGFTGYIINNIEYICNEIKITGFVGNNGKIPIDKITKIEYYIT